MTPIVTLGSGQEVEGLVFDTVDLNDEATWSLEGLTIAPPSKRLQRLSAADADSDILAEVARHDLRTVTARLRYEGAAGMDSALGAIRDLVGRLQRAEELEQGSPLTWTPATSTRTGTMYVQSGEITEMPIELDGDNAGWLISNPRPVITVRFDCFPFIHLPEYSALVVTSNSARILTLAVADVPGDVPALGRLIITDSAGQPRRHIEIGGDRYGYDPASPSDLDITATEMTALAGTLSGSYIEAELTSAAIAIAEKTGLPHIGPHRLRAQLERTVGSVGIYVRAAIQTIDGPWVRLPWRAIPPVVGTYDLLLGEATLTKVLKGAQFSTIRIEAYTDSPTSAICRLHRVNPIPTEVVYAVCRSRESSVAPTSFPILDRFNQTAGALAGKTAGAGGTWAGAGDADDFTVEATGHTARRTATGDSSATPLAGRLATVGSSTFDAVTVEASVRFSARADASATAAGGFGVLARYVDTSNFLAAVLYPNDLTPLSMFAVVPVIGGIAADNPVFSAFCSAVDTWYRIRLMVNRMGEYSAWLAAGTDPFLAAPTISGRHVGLAAGAAAASGKVGLIDCHPEANAITRDYDNLVAFPPVESVALNANRSADIAHNYAVRENAGGTGWADMPSYQGRRIFVPPAGPGDLSTRLVVKDRRNDVDGGEFDSADSARQLWLLLTPRYLAVP